jgi:pyruvate/2-oxoglutarate dehydrogenase complex dihydrolipoamide acyltransferase (E2) component
MPSLLIDVPMPSMGATVSELTVVKIVVAPGATVAKGQKLAELESDKSAFDFESPAAGTILEVRGAAGDVKRSGDTLFRMSTEDESLRHLAVATAQHDHAAAAAPAAPARNLVWTPRALKLAQEAGLDPATVHDIEATGPGGRVSGDDVAKYLAARK